MTRTLGALLPLVRAHGHDGLTAETSVNNPGSQRVLEKNGFVRFGLAQRYLRIAGQWRDHVLFQLLNPVEV
jgi:ribosomal-protein-alanine N-acetyltransferase